jgi:hypothetical protein
MHRDGLESMITLIKAGGVEQAIAFKARPQLQSRCWSNTMIGSPAQS